MEEITLCTLMAGRFYSLEAYFWGLSIIDYPKDKINYLILTNSDSDDFKLILRNRIGNLTGYKSVRLFETNVVPPSLCSFIERGMHMGQHAEVIAKLYNELYSHIDTEYFIFLEDDIIAPSNLVKGLLECFADDVGYACGVQRCRHNDGLFAWDLGVKKVFPENDACQEKQFYGIDIRKPWGIKEIGMGHFGLTLLKKSISEKLPKPIFRPTSNIPATGALVGCDIVYCLELEKYLGLKRICNFNIRGHHMDTAGKIH